MKEMPSFASNSVLYKYLCLISHLILILFFGRLHEFDISLNF